MEVCGGVLLCGVIIILSLAGSNISKQFSLLLPLCCYVFSADQSVRLNFTATSLQYPLAGRESNFLCLLFCLPGLSVVMSSLHIMLPISEAQLHSHLQYPLAEYLYPLAGSESNSIQLSLSSCLSVVLSSMHIMLPISSTTLTPLITVLSVSCLLICLLCNP